MTVSHYDLDELVIISSIKGQTSIYIGNEYDGNFSFQTRHEF